LNSVAFGMDLGCGLGDEEQGISSIELEERPSLARETFESRGLEPV